MCQLSLIADRVVVLPMKCNFARESRLALAAMREGAPWRPRWEEGADVAIQATGAIPSRAVTLATCFYVSILSQRHHR